MLDREVLLHFRDTPTKNRVMHSVSADLLGALQTAPVPGPRPASFGGKCDLLAIDSSGRLLAVEVKPKGVPTIVWAPAQAIVYARLLHLWTRHDPDAAQILSGMIASAASCSSPAATRPCRHPSRKSCRWSPCNAACRGNTGTASPQSGTIWRNEVA
jgi:hypothetical protein